MVKLRLRRSGKKKAAFFRIVATDSRVQRDGQYIELVGTYNPINGDTEIKKDIALKWLQNGAQPTDTVRVLLSKNGVMKELHDLKQTAKKGTVAKKSTATKKPATKKPATKKAEPKKAAAKSSTATKKAPVAKPAAKPATKK
ncbi:30S ribosomal protein S16 [Spiroplasma endosymbiont of Crioceris asparagi]|uniref:30S ribosomal protein S16 n=1 Tax=Spiroplasma endosymbiont of Crioceris asparagi TaxID=3066286 RepID=UPI0030D56F4D